jgi:hypothetical protein
MADTNILIEKLDQFIRKFYTNKLLRGLIYAFTLLLSFFLVAAILNYFGQFKSTGRTILFFTFLAGVIGVLIFNVVFPILKLTKITKGMSHEDAAQMVGDHFADVKDKILNTLQLSKNNQSVSPEQMQLVTASINQRTRELKPLPFMSAVDFKENRKHLKFLLIPIAIFAIIYIGKSEIIEDGTNRLINYNDASMDIIVMPFELSIDNEELSVLEQDDFVLNVTVNEKEYTPDNVYITVDGARHKLKKINKKQFTYTFRNVQEAQKFKVSAEDVSTKSLMLNTIPKPSLLGFDVLIDYPNHTGISDEKLKNVGDLMLPEGTKVKWEFATKNTDAVSFRLADSMIQLLPKGINSFEVENQFFDNVGYSIATQNEFSTGKDSINYYVTITKDNYPSIGVTETMDSTNKMVHYYNGNVTDDYGFSKLNFNYKIITADGKTRDSKSQSLAVSKTFNKEQFFHYFDLTTLGLDPGEKVEYYFQVWDNDGVNGAKSSKSRSQIYKAPTLQEMAENADKANDEIKDDLQKSKDEADELKKELDEIKKALLQKEKPDWQDKNKIEQFLNKQEKLEQNLEKLQMKNQENQKEQNQFNQQSEEILKKQEMINKLFDELMTEEMKELYKELREMMEKMDKDKMLEKMDDIQMSQEEINKELDRALEQFKQLEFEQKMEDITQQLDKLAEKQEKLAEETKEKEKSNFELNKEQEEINKEFEEIQKQIDEADKLNEELEKKNEMPDTEKEEEEISKDQKESQEDLGEKKNKKAAEKQKDAADKMEEMSQKMKSAMESNEEAKAEEDMDALRQLLENLIDFSFDQEEVMEGFRGLDKRDPKYVDLGQRQQKLQDDAKLLEDSLFALSKRILQLSPFINKEVTEMNSNIEKSIKLITERQTAQTMGKQQYVMTSVNNLALLFDEALKQMQKQQASGKPGSGSCNKPGGTGSSAGDPKSMKQMQEQMKKQLEKMKALAAGKKPGGEKPGEKGEGGSKPGGEKPGGQGAGGEGGQKMSEGLAKMAAEQGALRKQIQEMSDKLNEDGSGAGNGLKEIAKDLEKMEEDIVNGHVDQSILTRQQDIMTRLLEHDKAQREQDFDDKRKSNEAINQEYSNPTEYLEYKLKKEKELELLKTIPPSLKPYYKNKVNEYFEQIDQ